MKKYSRLVVQWGLTMLFALVVFLFWNIKYPFVLSYQEQFQLFLANGSYFREALAVPGGLARYLAEWFGQLYISFTAGAIVLAVAYVLIQRLVWRLCCKVFESEGNQPLTAYYPLTFLPSVLLWVLMGDESVLLAYGVSLVVCLAAMCVWPVTLRWQLPAAAVLIPLVYWIAGPMVLMVAVFVALRLLASNKGRGLLVGVAVILWAVACILLSANITPYPTDRLLAGIGYYRLLATHPLLMALIPLLCALLPFLLRMLPAIRACKTRYASFATFTLLTAVAAAILVADAYDPQKYELMEYDHLVRTKQWDAIVAKAEKHHPDLPMSVCANNLALAMNGQLGDRIFEFYQHGSEGLLPPFQKHFTSDQLTGEVAFYLGLVNTAQRLAMESMEALPDQRKSVRVVKRLAETNLINGQYDVARKYLNLLQQTIFYRDWARQMEALLADEDKINAHPLYGWLRKSRLDNNFLYSEDEADKACGQLLMKNPENMMAVQYLLMMPLLDGDLDRFMQYYQVVNEQIEYHSRAVQEAVAFACMQARRPVPPGTVNPVVLRSLDGFMRAWQDGPQSTALDAYKNTVWYYLTVGQSNIQRR